MGKKHRVVQKYVHVTTVQYLESCNKYVTFVPFLLIYLSRQILVVNNALRLLLNNINVNCIYFIISEPQENELSTKDHLELDNKYIWLQLVKRLFCAFKHIVTLYNIVNFTDENPENRKRKIEKQYSNSFKPFCRNSQQMFDMFYRHYC